jgi:hypothetical protein
MLQNCYICNIFLSFYLGHKKYRLSQKLWWMDIECSDAYLKKFVHFFNFLKIHFHNTCICFYEPKHHMYLAFF